MADQMSLDGILNDEKPEAPETPAAPAAPEAAPAPAAEPQAKPQSRRHEHQDKEYAARGLNRDPETGQFAPKVEPPAEPAAAVAPAAPAPPAPPPKQPEMSPQERALLAAAQDERRKRQAVEAEIAALRAAQPKEPEKAFFDDPEGSIKNLRAEFKTEILNARVQTAESIARGRYQDFGEKIDVFKELVAANPQIGQMCANAADPAEFAYRVGKNHMELAQAGGVDGLRQKIEQETEARVRTQIEAELKAKAEKSSAERAALPGSLSDARSSGVNRPVWGGPTSLDSILGKG